MDLNTRRIEKGQSLVIVTLIVVAIMAVLALVIDGGMMLASRRKAQVAADAAALAGARAYCLESNISTAQANAAAAITDYAIARNEAESVSAQYGSVGRVVTVTTQLDFNTFFAHFIGQPVITVEAEAAAGCFTPNTADGPLPIAWACRPPIAGDSADDDDVGDEGDSGMNCVDEAITRETLDTYLANPLPSGQIYPELYIVMDAATTASVEDYVCSPAGNVDCDVDNDGTNDFNLLPGGDRAWIDLTGGGGGAAQLRRWIAGTEQVELRTHTWVETQSGVANSIYQAVDDFAVGQVRIVPVYDIVCTQGNPNTYYTGDIHPGVIVVPGGVGKTYYHIISFSAFYITCVDAPGASNNCPGHENAVDNGIFADNMKTIEGYFISGWVEGLGGSGGADSDSRVFWLTK